MRPFFLFCLMFVLWHLRHFVAPIGLVAPQSLHTVFSIRCLRASSSLNGSLSDIFDFLLDSPCWKGSSNIGFDLFYLYYSSLNFLMVLYASEYLANSS